MINSIVRINKNLKLGQKFNGIEVKSSMLTYKNRLAEVTYVDVDGSFKLDVTGDNYLWDNSMVTVVAEKLKTNDSVIYSLKSIVTDLVNIEVANDEQIDLYINSSIATAKEVINVLEEKR